MEFVGQVDGKMIDAIHGAKKIKLDIDGGDRTITMDAHFEEMLDIGAMVIARTNATVVMIYARNEEDKVRTIQFFPHSGEWKWGTDEWADTRMCETSVVINDPTSKSLWNAISKYQLDFRSDGGNNWTFKGTYDNVTAFLREYFFRRFPALAEEHIEDGGIIILN